MRIEVIGLSHQRYLPDLMSFSWGKRTTVPLSTAQNRSTIMAKLYPLYPAELGQIVREGSEGGEGRREGGEERGGREDGKKARGGDGEERREDGSKGGDSKHNITQISSAPLGNISVGHGTHKHTHKPTFPEWSTPHPGGMMFHFLFSMSI